MCKYFCTFALQNEFVSMNSLFSEKNKQHILFLLFLLALWVKNVLFHAYVLDNSMPWGAWQCHIAKLCVAVCIASFVYVSKRPWWTLIVLILVDIWGVSNWVYFRANGLFVSVSMLSFAGNIKGYTSSITNYIDGRTFLFLLPTLLYAVALWFMPRKMKRRWTPFALSLLIGTALVMVDNALINEQNRRKGHNYGPLTVEKVMPFHVSEHRMMFDWEAQYSLIRDHSLIGYFPLHFIYERKLQRYRERTINTFSDQEKEWLSAFMQPDSSALLQPNSNLLIILVESLETWPLYYPGITPNMNRLASGPHTLYADKIKSQVRHGVSGDGHLITNTGVLPLHTGVACILYASNVYPNIAHLYPRSAAINPSNGTWNISQTMPAYGYRKLLSAQSVAVELWSDREVCDQTARWMLASDSLSCALAMTISSHSPFTRIRGHVPAITPDTPDEMRRYLTCVHFADSCIGLLLDSLEAHGRLENTTVVITGDHAIFHESERQHFLEYAQAHDLPITASDLYIPLIIYSPHAKEHLHVTEPCYQMDIYPTILSVIGCEQYEWKGFGVNLYDPDARTHRPISEEDAYRLSDKIISNNWFQQ